MANANAPFGFAPVQYLSGAPWSGQARLYVVLAADTNALYIGDPVASAGNADANGVPAVTIGVAGSAIRGIIVSAGGLQDGGFLGDPTNLNSISPAVPGTKSKNYYILVVDDPMVIFEAQENSSGGAIALTNATKNANFVIAAPATGVNVSGTMIASNTVATTSTLNVKLMGLAQRTNNAQGTNAVWLCTINSHEFKAGTTGV